MWSCLNCQFYEYYIGLLLKALSLYTILRRLFFFSEIELCFVVAIETKLGNYKEMFMYFYSELITVCLSHWICVYRATFLHK